MKAPTKAAGKCGRIPDQVSSPGHSTIILPRLPGTALEIKSIETHTSQRMYTGGTWILDSGIWIPYHNVRRPN